MQPARLRVDAHRGRGAFPPYAAEEEARPRPSDDERRTVDDATESLRDKLKIEGRRTSYLQGTESMQRMHISPRIGSTPADRVTRSQVEAVAIDMLQAGLAPKSVRHVMTFLHSVFEHAIDKGWGVKNPVRRATRPKRRRAGDVNPDLQFLTLAELKRVLAVVPDEVVHRQPAPTRRAVAARRRRSRRTYWGRCCG